jgi:potassium uptake TrkH family protein
VRYLRRPHPAKYLLLTFAAAILIGGSILMLPIAKTGPGGASPIEAFFTAVSAVCVTGHIIVDTATFWTGFGQVIILLMIQIGGFGVMTFASIIGLAVVRRLSLSGRLRAAAEVKAVGLDDVRSLVVGVVRISLTIEAIVFVLLTLRFWLGYGYSVGEAAWLGVFHAVSSFNNAGFSLFSDNLVGFVGDPLIGLPICAAIILGGIGFPVIMQLKKHWRRPVLWSMNTKLVLWGTILLLLTGWGYITVLEWNNPGTLGPLDFGSKLLAGFFQSVQTRTAGFNSIDLGQLDSATLLGMDALMFIGGGAAGTAGGIKITTFGVLFFIVLAEIRGEPVVNIFGKRLSRAVHREAIAVALLSVTVVGAATAVLMLLTDFSLDRLLFESVSAFATVGLSTGITPDLGVPGQLVLMFLMFVGRLGTITFASALALRDRHILYDFPKERPIIG